MSNKIIQMRGICTYIFMLFSLTSLAQTFGPNTPSVGTNTTGIGTNAWLTPGNSLLSDNSYATVSTKGITNYLATTGYSFALPVTTSINGIQLDVERSTNSPTVVAILNSWLNMPSTYTYNVSAGTNRCLVFAISSENGNGARDVTAVSWGGQTMTQAMEAVVGTSGGFQGKVEIWYMLESKIASAVGNTFTITYDATTLNQNAEMITAACYQFVDQANPVPTSATFTSTGTGSTISGSAIFATKGGVVINVALCGQNTTPNSTNGSANTYIVSNTFTETLDTYTSNAGAATSGMCTEISHQSVASSANVTPSFTFGGTPNRQVIISIDLQALMEVDNSVRLIKGGAVVGSNLALTTQAWTTADNFVTYGGASQMWGTTWINADVNAANFGAAVSASVSNGTAQVDEMQITVYATNTLPVELIDFWGNIENNENILKWTTLSELNCKEFVIERSDNTCHFQEIVRVRGNSTTSLRNDYEFFDTKPAKGLNYYRLKQIDFDGNYKYYKIIVLVNSYKDKDLVVYPNPSSNGDYKLMGLNLLTSVIEIYSDKFNLISTIYPNGKENMDFTLKGLADGSYYLIYYQEGKQRIKQIIKTCK